MEDVTKKRSTTIYRLKTKRLILRPLRESDATRIFELCNNDVIYKSLLTMPHPYTMDDARNKITKDTQKFETGEKYCFAITFKENDELIGIIDITNNQKFRFGEIGFWLDDTLWNKGIMTEATQAVVHFGFKTLKLHKLIIKAYVNNFGSIKVAEKCGFIKEGTMKECYYVHGEYQDLFIFGLTEDDYDTNIKR